MLQFLLFLLLKQQREQRVKKEGSEKSGCFPACRVNRSTLMTKIILFLIIFFAFIFRHFLLVIVRLPLVFIYKVYDTFDYFYNKRYKDFTGFGLHIYCGMFGSGKTLSLVRHAYSLAKRYPDLTIYTNIQLFNFPHPERIYKLENYNQLITAPPDTLFIVDEISSLFNSRKWADFPFVLLSQLLQVRKNRKMIIATAQRFSHVDKLLRDVTTTVIDCSCYFKRLCINRSYDPLDYESATIYSPEIISYLVYLATDKLRNSYDTYELITDDVKGRFLSNHEVLGLRGESPIISVVSDAPKNKKFFPFRKKK